MFLASHQETELIGLFPWFQWDWEPKGSLLEGLGTQQMKLTGTLCRKLPGLVIRKVKRSPPPHQSTRHVSQEVQSPWRQSMSGLYNLSV